jgi:ATP-dependent RNA helicase SUPV3L1/SUV3
MIPVIKNLCSTTGDMLSIINYERLTPLKVSRKAVNNYKNITSGDCVVGFSRKVLYDIKKQIELQNPDVKCCVI